MALSGTYKITSSTPMGRQEGRLVLEDAGGTLKGTLTALGSTVDIPNGRASGDAFEFAAEANTPMGAIKIAVKGLVEGNRISGSIMTNFGNMAFEGMRIE
jgi:hypothetical protein